MEKAISMDAVGVAGGVSLPSPKSNKLRYSREEMMKMRHTNKARPVDMIDFNPDGSRMACSMLVDANNFAACNWVQMSSALQDIASSYNASKQSSSPTKQAKHSPYKHTNTAGNSDKPASPRIPALRTSTISDDASNYDTECSPAASAIKTEPRTPASDARQPPQMSVVPSDVIIQLVTLLSSEDPTIAAQAAQQLAVVAFMNPTNQSEIMLRGATSPLKNMLSGRATPDENSNAAAAIWALTIGNSANQAIAVDHNVVVRLVRLLGSTSTAIVYTAVSALKTLAKDNPQRQQVFLDSGAIPMLVNVLRSGCSKGKQTAAEVLEALAIGNYVNQAALVKEKAIPYLVDMLTLPETELGAWAAATNVVFHLISGHKNTYIEAVVQANAIQRLKALRGKTGGCNSVKLAKWNFHVKAAAVLTKLQDWVAEKQQEQMRLREQELKKQQREALGSRPGTSYSTRPGTSYSTRPGTSYSTRQSTASSRRPSTSNSEANCQCFDRPCSRGRSRPSLSRGSNC